MFWLWNSWLIRENYIRWNKKLFLPRRVLEESIPLRLKLIDGNFAKLAKFYVPQLFKAQLPISFFPSSFSEKKSKKKKRKNWNWEKTEKKKSEKKANSSVWITSSLSEKVIEKLFEKRSFPKFWSVFLFGKKTPRITRSFSLKKWKERGEKWRRKEWKIFTFDLQTGRFLQKVSEQNKLDGVFFLIYFEKLMKIIVIKYNFIGNLNRFHF